MSPFMSAQMLSCPLCRCLRQTGNEIVLACYLHTMETELWVNVKKDVRKRLKSQSAMKSKPCSLEHWAAAVAEAERRVSSHLLFLSKTGNGRGSIGHKPCSQTRSVIISEVFMTAGNTENISKLPHPQKTAAAAERKMLKLMFALEALRCRVKLPRDWEIRVSHCRSWLEDEKVTAMEFSFCFCFYSLQQLFIFEVALQQFMVENIAIFFHTHLCMQNNDKHDYRCFQSNWNVMVWGRKQTLGLVW